MVQKIKEVKALRRIEDNTLNAPSKWNNYIFMFYKALLDFPILRKLSDLRPTGCEQLRSQTLPLAVLPRK